VAKWDTCRENAPNEGAMTVTATAAGATTVESLDTCLGTVPKSDRTGD
jgi:hypothetical protein